MTDPEYLLTEEELGELLGILKAGEPPPLTQAELDTSFAAAMALAEVPFMTTNIAKSCRCEWKPSRDANGYERTRWEPDCPVHTRPGFD